jgi:cardiolipin synthase
VKVLEYQPRALHAKTMVVDSAWCTVGTANLDYRSLDLNLEINLVPRCGALEGVAWRLRRWL